MLAGARARPEGMLVAASCHTAADVARAGALGLDFAVLGPVLPTPTHPQAVPLRWDGFAVRAAGARLPVYALGGLTAADLDCAVDAGAHGVALRRAAWPGD
jgi:8-oxo-dGTP diphosphatase